MKLHFTKGLHPDADAFGAMIDNGELYVPHELMDAFSMNPPRDAERLVATMQTFPTSFCKALSWDYDRFQEAYGKLVALLEGRVRDVILHPPPPRQFAMGARPPPGHPVQIGHIVGSNPDPEQDPDPEAA